MEQGALTEGVQYVCISVDRLVNAKDWMKNNVDNGTMDIEDILHIMDPHTLLEHMYANLVGEEFLCRVEMLHKLHINTLSQGISMTSFQQQCSSSSRPGKLK